MLEQAEETPKALDLNKYSFKEVIKFFLGMASDQVLGDTFPRVYCTVLLNCRIYFMISHPPVIVIGFSNVCIVQPKAKMYLQFESSKLSTTWGYLSAIGLCVTTFRMISLMSGFFLKPDAMFDEYVYDAVPLFGSFLSISVVSELCTPSALVCLYDYLLVVCLKISMKEKVHNGKKANRETREPRVDSELMYAYAKIDRLVEVEEFILVPNVANLPNVGDRLYDEGLYEAAKIILAFISNWAKLASILVKLKQFQGAVDAARKANSSKTWKEVCFACVDAEEFRLAQICGLDIIIQYDEYDNAATTIMNHSPGAWGHMQFKDVAVKVAYFELYYKAVHFYLEEHLDLINVICLTCLHFANNVTSGNDALNEIYVEEEDCQITYVALFEQIEKHELLKMRRVAAYIYRKAGMNLDADSLVTVAACVEAPLLLSSCIALAPKLNSLRYLGVLRGRTGFDGLGGGTNLFVIGRLISNLEPSKVTF
ncbi:hypothetical protein RHSIM_Rhsim12G0068700 [Rhododendron simsii]|uniref:Uncharacterized protein n=1 Tax=Rhododendron simsii TaxID=118357 RepID=A0A834L9I2_RHOSS|nr:hypothetical protein RHSIM_Rhsim12G0068700 [Rhododendron simsii]